MTNAMLMKLIGETCENNFAKLELSDVYLTQLPPEILEFKDLTELTLSGNRLNQLSPIVREFKKLIKLNLSENQITKLPPEIRELKDLKILSLIDNKLTQVPQEIGELTNLTELLLSENKLTQLPPEIGELKNLTRFDLSKNQLTQLPPEIGELKNLKILYLNRNKLTKLPPEIGELENLTKLDVSQNQIIQLPPEIGELKNLTELYASENQLTQLPPVIGELKKLEILYLYRNQLTELPHDTGKLNKLTKLYISKNRLSQLPPEIGELKNLTEFYASENQIKHLPQEIGELDGLTELCLSNNQLTELPREVRELKNLTKLYASKNLITQLPQEIGELKNLTKLDLSKNQLTKLPKEIRELKKLIILDLASNRLTHLPHEIGELRNLTEFLLCDNSLTQLPPEFGKLINLTYLELSSNFLTHLPSGIGEFNHLEKLSLSKNSLTFPPPEIVSSGLDAILIYLKQSRTIENNEAKLILVGAERVGKTCLAHRLINNEFLRDSKITEGINISKWKISAPNSEKGGIKLNIWDFGGQEIYHATHQFFLTKRSLYLLLWNAMESNDYDHIYYWLHTIEAFGEDSPIILVMSKMNDKNDDLNLKDLKNKFPQIVDYLKIDSKDGRGIYNLTENIKITAWNLPLMRAKWVDSWFKVRQKLEILGEDWISYDRFYETCKSEGLDNLNITVLDEYLHDLGVTLHFKDRLALKNIVILKPEWATNAFYKILSTKSVLDNEGILQQGDLSQIWDKKTYPPSIHPQLMDLMNKFELSYELPDNNSYLVPELLPKEEPNDFEWNKEDDLFFYYCYDNFLPPGIIPRFIVRMHEDLEVKENKLPLCWREGAVLKFQDSHAFVKIKSVERKIEIRIKGENKRRALDVICYHIDHINASIKKINISKEIPCNCSENCPNRYYYEDLLRAEKKNIKTIQCHKSYKNIQISSLLEGYKVREEKLRDSGKTGGLFEYDVFICHSSKDKPIIKDLITDLIKEGITYWVDAEQIHYGDSITQKIEEGLQKSRYVIPCLSKNLKTSGWTSAEYGTILNAEFGGNLNRIVIPLKLDNCETNDIPMLLRDKKRVTYSNKDEFKEFIEFLKNRAISY